MFRSPRLRPNIVRGGGFRSATNFKSTTTLGCADADADTLINVHRWQFHALPKKQQPFATTAVSSDHQCKDQRPSPLATDSAIHGGLLRRIWLYHVLPFFKSASRRRLIWHLRTTSRFLRDVVPRPAATWPNPNFRSLPSLLCRMDVMRAGDASLPWTIAVQPGEHNVTDMAINFCCLLVGCGDNCDDTKLLGSVLVNHRPQRPQRSFKVSGVALDMSVDGRRCVMLRNMTVSQSPMNGIEVNAGLPLRVVSCHVTDCEGSGISATDGSTFGLCNVSLMRNQRSGLFVSQSEGSMVDVVCRDNKRCGVYAFSGGKIDIYGNLSDVCGNGVGRGGEWYGLETFSRTSSIRIFPTAYRDKPHGLSHDNTDGRNVRDLDDNSSIHHVAEKQAREMDPTPTTNVDMKSLQIFCPYRIGHSEIDEDPRKVAAQNMVTRWMSEFEKTKNKCGRMI